MAKKRKTKKEKLTKKEHQFTPYIDRTPSIAKSSGKEETATTDRNKPRVSPYVYKDLKKISILMGVFLVVVGATLLILINLGLAHRASHDKEAPPWKP